MNDPSFLEQLRSLAMLDLVGLAVVAGVIALGLWRGLWWQVIRLVGIVIAVGLARLFHPEVALWIGESWSDVDPRLAHGVAWVSVFLLTLGAASILGLLGQKLIEAMQLGFANRLAGAVLGAGTGVVLHVAFLAGFCQLAPEGVVAKNVPGTYSERLLQEAGARWRVVLGAEAATELDKLFAFTPAESPEAPAGEGTGESPGASADPSAPGPTGVVRRTARGRRRRPPASLQKERRTRTGKQV